MKFLVIQQKMIGDVLASTVICESIKYHFPNSEVHFVANENTIPVIKHNPFIDKVIIFKNENRKSKKIFYKFLKSIKKENEYHTVFDAYGKLESNLISYFARAKNKITQLKWYSSWIYSDTIVENLTPNGVTPLAIQNRLSLLEPLLSKQNQFIPYPKIFLTETEIEQAKSSLEKIKTSPNQKIIMIGILGSNPMKTYPDDYMAQVLDTICNQTEALLLFNYIPSQKKEALAIYEKCSTITKKSIAIDFYAPSLRDFIAILSQCSALIGNEGGAVNMAKALDIPTFCMFSPFIIKGAWHTENENHEGVHLSDYYTDIIKDMSKKEIKTQIKKLYSKFEPQFFNSRLINFLARYSS